MTARTYKTARGRTIDIGALVLKNENTRAVGNMGVNARGDKIDSMGNVIQSRAELANQRYQSRPSNVTNQPVSQAHQTAAAPAPVATAPVVKPKREVPEVNKLAPDTDVTTGQFLNVVPEEFAAANAEFEEPKEEEGGLAAALKKAKQK